MSPILGPITAHNHFSQAMGKSQGLGWIEKVFSSVKGVWIAPIELWVFLDNHQKSKVFGGYRSLELIYKALSAQFRGVISLIFRSESPSCCRSFRGSIDGKIQEFLSLINRFLKRKKYAWGSFPLGAQDLGFGVSLTFPEPQRFGKPPDCDPVPSLHRGLCPPLSKIHPGNPNPGAPYSPAQNSW